MRMTAISVVPSKGFEREGCSRRARESRRRAEECDAETQSTDLRLTGVDEITVLGLERLPSLLLGASGLGDNELDIVLLHLDVRSTSRWSGLSIGISSLGLVLAFELGRSVG